jgi:hypothetical protein
MNNDMVDLGGIGRFPQLMCGGQALGDYLWSPTIRELARLASANFHANIAK